jgi:subtilisin family serine protease
MNRMNPLANRATGGWLARPTGQIDGPAAKPLPALSEDLRPKPLDRSAPPIVAIFDDGVAVSHEDLDQAMWRNPGEIERDLIDNDGNGVVDDVFGMHLARGDGHVDVGDSDHGTHLAGIVAAEDNGIGVTGVAAGVAQVMAVSGMYDLELLSGFEKAVDYVVRMKTLFGANIRVVNASWGAEYRDAGMQRRWVAAVQKLADADILFVAATDNAFGRDMDGKPDYPANIDLPNVITVAAMNGLGTDLAVFSAKGKRVVELAAPGDSIRSTVPRGYSYESGTSMAAPHVAAAAARMFARNPDLTAAQAREILMSTVTPLATLRDKVSSGGKLNIAAAEARAAELRVEEERFERGLRARVDGQ